MKTRNKLLTILTLASGAAASVSIINKTLSIFAVSKHLLEDDDSLCFKWRLGNIHYTKHGKGKPLLLIHDLNPSFCGFEWRALNSYLSESYTVYTIDLFGCGRSEKPNLTYTNYLYVQLIADFIKSEIGHRTNVIASGTSSSIAIMACSNSPELFDQMLFINPESVHSSGLYPGKNAKLYKLILDMPVIGTLIYNISCSRNTIKKDFLSKYFYNPFTVRSKYVDSFYEAAHLGKSPKSVYASVKCSYTRCNISTALKKIDNSIYLICGDSFPFSQELIEEYEECNPAIEAYTIHNSRALPHMENPIEVYKLIQTVFS